MFAKPVARENQVTGILLAVSDTIHRDHEIDVPSRPEQTGCDDGKTADYNVTGAALIEFATQANEVSLQRRTRV
jgi:hypothetical protein